ncbi:MAG: bifunctional oligoribonuclease/PAP phosphatase NrnA [Spirochaetaceae bacterium]|jgi:phosphoesterase RecJ-like protein|nr:bifunctional oligoribonuclease/PAP phosphatase NrnA [Spirochaetaceae bacterium]
MGISAPVPQPLLDFIRQGAKFLLAGHKDPDGDCVGSQLALASALARLGKKAVLCSAGPFKRPELSPYADRFRSRISEEDREGARVIIADCSDLERTGDIGPRLEGLPRAVIDHHITNTLEDGVTLFLDVKAPAAAFMVFALIEALGLSPSEEEAGYLFLGLCTDTGFFRHLDHTGAEAFRRAARMIELGANPRLTFNTINGGKSFESRKLIGLVLARAEAHYNGRLIVSSENYEEARDLGARGRDSDSLYQLLMAVKGVEAVAIIRQEQPDSCSLGLRSRDRVNVAEVARHFGGGGHKNASGATVGGLAAELMPQVIEAFSAQMDAPPEAR